MLLCKIHGGREDDVFEEVLDLEWGCSFGNDLEGWSEAGRIGSDIDISSGESSGDDRMFGCGSKCGAIFEGRCRRKATGLVSRLGSSGQCNVQKCEGLVEGKMGK